MVELNSRLNILIARGEVCHRLSAKTLFYESVVNDPSETVHSAEGPFWCAVTQSLIGPDGKFADTEACRAGRGRGCCQTA
jgi:hypothetical protein